MELEGPSAFWNQTEGKLSWRYSYLALSEMSSKVTARCPREGKASRNMLKATVLTHTAPCAGPETLPWLVVSLYTRHQWDMSHEGTSFEICGPATNLWKILPGIRHVELWPEDSVPLMSSQNGNSILWGIYVINSVYATISLPNVFFFFFSGNCRKLNLSEFLCL